MVTSAGLANLVLGVGLAVQAPRDPERTATIEMLAGIALITGLSFIGCGLRFIY